MEWMAPFMADFDKRPMWHIAMPGAGAIHSIGGAATATAEDHHEGDGGQRPRVPFFDLVQNRVGDTADEIRRDLQPIEFFQMATDVTHAHIARIHGVRHGARTGGDLVTHSCRSNHRSGAGPCRSAAARSCPFGRGERQSKAPVSPWTIFRLIPFRRLSCTGGGVLPCS